jgi:hypothetical protein
MMSIVEFVAVGFEHTESTTLKLGDKSNFNAV